MRNAWEQGPSARAVAWGLPFSALYRLLIVLGIAVLGVISPTTASASPTLTTYACVVYAYDTAPRFAAPDISGLTEQAPPAGNDPRSAGNSVRASRIGVAAKTGGLQVVGSGFSASERAMAEQLASQGRRVVLREADSAAGPTSDLLLDGIPYDVYTPRTGSVDSIVRAVAAKGYQVQGGGVVVDLCIAPGLLEAPGCCDELG